MTVEAPEIVRAEEDRAADGEYIGDGMSLS
jgi:hypothetical protein